MLSLELNEVGLNPASFKWGEESFLVETITL